MRCSRSVCSYLVVPTLCCACSGSKARQHSYDDGVYVVEPAVEVRIVAIPKQVPPFGPHTMRPREDILAVEGAQCLALTMARVTATTTPDGIVLTLLTTSEHTALLRDLVERMVDDHNRFHFVDRGQNGNVAGPITYIPATASFMKVGDGASIRLSPLVMNDVSALRTSILQQYLTSEPPNGCAAELELRARAGPPDYGQ